LVHEILVWDPSIVVSSLVSSQVFISVAELQHARAVMHTLISAAAHLVSQQLHGGRRGQPCSDVVASLLSHWPRPAGHLCHSPPLSDLTCCCILDTRRSCFFLQQGTNIVHTASAPWSHTFVPMSAETNRHIRKPRMLYTQGRGLLLCGWKLIACTARNLSIALLQRWGCVNHTCDFMQS
jgi:hypothetical protein